MELHFSLITEVFITEVFMKINKRILAPFLALALTALMGAFLSPAFAAAKGYSDVPQGHWASGVIAKWSGGERGVLQGNGDGTFAPSRGLTLGELATVLAKIFKYTERVSIEVTPAWADDAVEKAVAAGVFDKAAAIDASVPVTREQAIRCIAVAYGVAPAGGNTAFADDSAIGAAYKPYVNAFRKKGFIVGKGSNDFDPQGLYTRAEAIQVIDNTSGETQQESSAKPQTAGPKDPATQTAPPKDPAKPQTAGPDNLTDGVVDLGDIEEAASKGKIEVSYREGGRIGMIDGAFTDKIVDSALDAADVLNAASSLFGPGFRADASRIELRSIDEGLPEEERFYRLSQSVNGVPVLGDQVILVTDGSGRVTGLFGAYDPRIEEVDTVPRLAAGQADRIAVLALLSDKDMSAALEEAGRALSTNATTLTERLVSLLPAERQLLVHAADAKKAPALVYGITLRNYGGGAATEDDEALLSTLPYFDRMYYIYANGGYAGSVFAVVSNLRTADWQAATDAARDMKGQDRRIDVQRLALLASERYRMKDALRDVTTYEVLHYKIPFMEPAATFSDKIVEKDSSGWNEKAVYAHANMEIVYDFYKGVLGRDSYDGYGAPISVNVELAGGDAKTKSWWTRNAFWDSSLSSIVFGSEYDPVTDVMGHEFTHAVIDFVVPGGGLYYSQESGGLEESYADIMGNFAENKTDEGRWTQREDSSLGVGRSFSAPAKYGQIEHYKEYKDSLDVHYSSGIFNLAAYKMMTDDRVRSISTNTWAKVFYRSLYRLRCDATFLDGRGAVISSAKALGFNSEQQQALKDAFDAVGITEPNSVRIVLKWGETPRDLDSHLVGPGLLEEERFHIYFTQRNFHKVAGYTPDSGSYAADLDYDDSTSYGPEITTIHKFTRGDYYFYVQDYSNQKIADSTEMANSGATVNVYRGSGATPVASYGISPSSSGTIWNVFKLTVDDEENVTLTPIDTYASSPTLQ
jgi:Zn-dependent metalloprotease